MNQVLTKREEIALNYHKENKNFHEIADILGISQHSAKALLKSAQRKLNNKG